MIDMFDELFPDTDRWDAEDVEEEPVVDEDPFDELDFEYDDEEE